MRIPVHTLVYYSKKEGKYVAACYELGQLSLGKNLQEAKNNLARAVEILAESADEDPKVFLFEGRASERVRVGLEKVFGRQTPSIERTTHFNIYCWEEK